MRRAALLTLALFLVLTACRERPDDAAVEPAEREVVKESPTLQEFMSAVSEGTPGEAFHLLHPELGKVWGKERFVKDWKAVRSRIGERWQPRLVAAEAARTPFGEAQHAAYVLTDKEDAIGRVSTNVVKVRGRERLLDISATVPYADGPPEEVKERLREFLDRMQEEQYQDALKLMTTAMRAKHTVPVLKQLSPLVSNPADPPNLSYHQRVSDGIWYHVAQVTQPDSNRVLELLFTDDGPRLISGVHVSVLNPARATVD